MLFPPIARLACIPGGYVIGLLHLFLPLSHIVFLIDGDFPAYINICPKCKVDGKTGMSTKEQVERGEACGFVPGAIVGMYHLANIATPIAVLLFGKGAQHSEQSPVEPLDLTVALWMIGSRAGV